MTDNKFFTILTASAILLWALLQGTVSTVQAAQAAPKPISFTATVGVGVENALPQDAVVIITDAKEE